MPATSFQYQLASPSVLPEEDNSRDWSKMQHVRLSPSEAQDYKTVMHSLASFSKGPMRIPEAAINQAKAILGDFAFWFAYHGDWSLDMDTSSVGFAVHVAHKPSSKQATISFEHGQVYYSAPKGIHVSSNTELIPLLVAAPVDTDPLSELLRGLTGTASFDVKSSGNRLMLEGRRLDLTFDELSDLHVTHRRKQSDMHELRSALGISSPLKSSLARLPQVDDLDLWAE